MVSAVELREQLQQAINRLTEVVEMERSDIVRDSAIQRFEFTFDLAWKTLKYHLEHDLGVQCKSPKECIREAYTQELIEYDKIWLDMVTDRNNTAHMYKESIADAVYTKLPKYLELFQQLHQKITHA